MARLYDVHTHVGIDVGFYLHGWWPYAATAQDLLTQMKANGIDRAVCFPFTLPSAFDAEAFASRDEVTRRPGRFPFDRENELLRQEIARLDTDKRLIQFGMFDPAREVSQQVKSLEGLIGSIGGLKAQTTVIRSRVSLLLDEARPIMQLAEKHNLPVLLHTSVAPSDSWAQAKDCLDVARAFPGVRFNLAHSLRFHAPLLREAAKLKNVWIDCSAHLAHCQLAREDSPAVARPAERVKADYARPAAVLATIFEMLDGRYLWGSDNPFMSWCADKLAIVNSYRGEAAVLHELPAFLRDQMASTAPEAWLFGEING